MLRTRVLSALVGIIILLAIAWQGGYWWQAFVVLAAVLSYREYYMAAAAGGVKPFRILGLIILACSLLSQLMHLPVAWITLLLILSAVILVFAHPKYSIIDLAVTWTGALYLGILWSYPARFALMDNHFAVIMMSFLLTWAGDTGAYFAGTWWGKRKLAPELSPNKTWAGLAGGTVLTIAVAILGIKIIPGHTIPWYILLGLLAALLGAVGDLWASAVKRYFGIKDFSQIIPGHGGVLDRFDSYLLVAPLVFYFLTGTGGWVFGS